MTLVIFFSGFAAGFILLAVLLILLTYKWKTQFEYQCEYNRQVLAEMRDRNRISSANWKVLEEIKLTLQHNKK